MDIDIDRLARRPEGPRLLVYLDQSTLSALATDGNHAELLELLRGAVERGRLICPVSPSHSDETARLYRRDSDAWHQIDKLADELALGIRFRGQEEIEYAEIYAAAAEFEDAETRPYWREAFHKSPHTPREELFFGFFGGQIRVRSYFKPDELQQDEIDHERRKEAAMDQVYEELRAKGFSFEEMAEGNLEMMISWKLGPLLAREEFDQLYLRRGAELIQDAQEQVFSEVDLSPGSALNRFMAFGTRRSQIERLVERHPEIARRPQEFRLFAGLRELPTLAFPALFRAALAACVGRRARLSDGHDITHLTHGLSRCDIVTADGGMAQLIRDYRLAPAGCEVFAYRELDELGAAIEEHLTAN